jgi:hypothetical protein
MVFGGLDQKGKHTNDMYKISVQFSSKTGGSCDILAKMNQIEYLNMPPSARAGHCAVAYRDRYIIILGGETDLSIGTHKKSRVEILNDVWVFDTETCVWQLIRPLNEAVFTKRNNFSAVLYNDSIIIFGGLLSIQTNAMSDDLIVLDLSVAKTIPKDAELPANICSICTLGLCN